MKKDVFGLILAIIGVVLIVVVIYSSNGKPALAPSNTSKTSTGSMKNSDTYSNEVAIDINSNSSASNAVTRSDGLKIEDTKIGTGKEVKSGDTISINYVGTLTNGKKFDSSYDRGQPFETQIGVGQVIKGWDEGVVGMKVGGKRKLTIPPELGYGSRGAGADIPPNATLIFEVELMGIK